MQNHEVLIAETMLAQYFRGALDPFDRRIRAVERRTAQVQEETREIPHCGWGRESPMGGGIFWSFCKDRPSQFQELGLDLSRAGLNWESIDLGVRAWLPWESDSGDFGFLA